MGNIIYPWRGYVNCILSIWNVNWKEEMVELVDVTDNMATMIFCYWGIWWTGKKLVLLVMVWVLVDLDLATRVVER